MIAVESDFNVLVIDDNSGDVPLIEDYLSEGFKQPGILHVKTFAEAKARISSAKKIDVVLLNLPTYDLEGEKLIKAIRKISGNTPIILLTNYSNDEFAIRALSFGVSDYINTNELSAAMLYKSITYSLEREKNNALLRESEEKYKSLFQFSPLPKWIYDTETLHFLNVNDSAMRLYGYSREEFLNMTILDIRPKEDIQMVKSQVAEIRKKGEFSKGSYRHLKKNGEIVDVQIESNDIHFEGRKARLVLSIDITDQLAFTKKH